MPKHIDPQSVLREFALPLAAAQMTGQIPSNVKQWIKSGQLASYSLADGRVVVRVSDLKGMESAKPGPKPAKV
jgi:hypothetical protein